MAFISAAHQLGSRCVAGCCKMLQGVVRDCRVLQGVAGCCRVLQGAAGCCRVLQKVAVCVAQHARLLVRPSPSPRASWAAGVLRGVAGCCRVLQGVAGYCRGFQFVAENTTIQMTIRLFRNVLSWTIHMTKEK